MRAKHISWWIYLSRTTKSFCCSRAWTKVIRKCLLLRRVENRVMPSSMLGCVVLVAWRQDETVIYPARLGAPEVQCMTAASSPNPIHHLLSGVAHMVNTFSINHRSTEYASPTLVPDRMQLSLNVPSWLNEPGLSMGATKKRCDGVLPLDCSHMLWFAAWQKENRGVH